MTKSTVKIHKIRKYQFKMMWKNFGFDWLMGESAYMKDNISTNFFIAIKQYKELPESTSLPKGLFVVNWIGPKWFQFLAKHGLGLFGFKNWLGKDFSGESYAINVFKDPASLEQTQKYPMRVTLANSAIDGKKCVQVSYPNSTHFPWPYVVDEFRVLKPGILLGVSFTKRLTLFPMPFYLISKE